MSTKKRRRIRCSTETRKEIMRLLGCSNVMVTHALCASMDTPLARAIRLEAMRRGGYEVIWAPCDKAWEDDGEVMRQYYPNGVEIVIDKAGASISILDCTEPIAHIAGAGIENILDAQRKALKASKKRDVVL